MSQSIFDVKGQRALVDLTTIAGAAVLVFLVASRLDLLEIGLKAVQRSHDVADIDELIVVLVFLAFAFAVFSWRRWQELAKETAKHREVAEALRVSEKKFSMAFASSPNPMVITSFPGGRILDLNEAAISAVGLRRDELVGRMGMELAFWSRPKDQEEIRKLLEAHSFIRNFEIEFRHASGELRYALLSLEQVEIAGEPSLLIVANDITGRKRAEDILQATQQQLQTVVNNAPITIFAIDENGIFTLSEGKGLERVGLRPGENVGVSAIDLYRSLPIVLQNGTAITCEDAVRRVLSGESISGETELRGVWFDNHFVPMRDAGGHVTGLVGVATDITDRRRAERDLQRSKEMYQELVENINDAIVSVNIDGRIAYISPVIESLTGFTPSEVIGKPFAEFIYPDDLPRLQEQFHNVLAGNLQDSEYRVFNKAREVRWFRSSSRPIINDGVVVGLRGIVTDVTDRHRKEEELLMFSNAIEQSGDCIMITDRNGVIDYVNGAFERVTGYARREVVGKTPKFLQSGVQDRAFYEAMWREILSGKNFRYAFTNRKKNGEHYTDDRTITPVKDEAGNITHFVSTGRDITERKLAEQQLKTSQDQLRALAAYLQNVREDERITIAREIHDELGQVLTALKMDLSILEKTIAEQGAGSYQRAVSAEIKEMSSLVGSAIRTVQRLVKELRPETLDTVGLVAALRWQAEQFQQHTRIHCEISLPTERVTLDPDRSIALFRILQEALTNVARHSNATTVLVKVVVETEAVVLEIEDNGRGISESEIANAQSFGILGMRERAIGFGGNVEVRGIPGKGTVVTTWISRG